MKIFYILFFLFFFSSFSHAQDNSTMNISSLLLFPFLFILMYFLLIRPQAKKAKEHKDLINNLKVNDEVITQCGMLGKILKITEQFVVISVNDTSNIIIKKDAISSYLPKGTLKQLK